jgi:hypothetical protein
MIESHTPMDNGGYFNHTPKEREALQEAIKCMEAIDSAVMPEKKGCPVLYPDTHDFRNGKLFGYDEALEEVRPYVAKLEKELKEIKDRGKDEKIKELEVELKNIRESAWCIQSTNRRLKEEIFFYKTRCEFLQGIQDKFKNPERKVICDVLANGYSHDKDIDRLKESILTEEKLGQMEEAVSVDAVATKIYDYLCGQGMRLLLGMDLIRDIATALNKSILNCTKKENDRPT